MRAKAIRVPASFFADLRRAARASQNGLDAAAKGVQADFAATTRTWNHQPEFTITAPSPDRRLITTDDAVWSMLDDGTRPHTIRPRFGKVLRFAAGGTPKSRRRYLGANKGSTGTQLVYARGVDHPGTEAREWSTAAQEKWDTQLPIVMQRAIDSEVT